MRPPSTRDARGGLGCVFAAATLVLFHAIAFAQSAPAIRQESFAPSTERGPVVVVASGNSGTDLYREFSSRLAAQGYYVVLVDGRDVSIRPNDPGGRDGAANLRSVIRDAQASPRAVPGKVALIGLSIGGIGVLGFGAPLKEQVSGVVLFYPALTFVGPDLQPMSSAMQVPILVLAGGKDTFAGCCAIETMNMFEAAPKSVPFELVVYPDAGHAFNLKTAPPPLVYRPSDAEDAWQRTLAFLGRHQPVRRDRPNVAKPGRRVGHPLRPHCLYRIDRELHKKSLVSVVH